MKLTVAVAQATPAVLDLAGCVAKACEWIREAGKRGAKILAFPETWMPVYPLWCDAGTLGKWGHEPSKKLHARLARVDAHRADCSAAADAWRAGEAEELL